MIPAVDILGTTYTVKHCESIDADGNELAGQIIYNSAEIEIAYGMPPDVERLTVLHELIHGVLAHTGHSKHCRNEDLVEAVSNGLVYLLRHNPALVAYLTESK